MPAGPQSWPSWSRGLSVYELEGTSAKDVRFFRERLNPQVQVADFR